MTHAPATCDRSTRRAATAASALLLALALHPGAAPARAADAPQTPAFSAPTAIANRYFPCVPGAVNVYSGVERGVAVTVVETCLRETRDFTWDGQTVTCRIVEQLTFRGGGASGRSRVFFAQADDGAVWTFGDVEVDDPDLPGETEADEPGGWIVGQRAAADPLDAVTGAAPALHMPADPKAGDSWTPEDAPPYFLESYRARSVHDVMRVPAGRFRSCLRVQATSPDGPRETHWFAPGIGLIRARTASEQLVLRATTRMSRR